MITFKPALSAEAAFKLVEFATGHARGNGWKIAAAVVDASGILVASLRMDEVSPPVGDFALDKAYTAATMKRSTEAFFARMDSEPSLRLGFGNRARLMVWGGGLPIFHEGRVVGGIGVSGAKDFEDIACAKAALGALGLAFEASN
jgi:uncharacterized protein GlcG (DUF336 family)